MRKLFTLVFLLVSISAFTQRSPLELGEPKSGEHLIKKVLLGDQEGIVVSNIRFRGNQYSVGTFYNPSSRALFDKGIVLTTGYIKQILGPNTKPNSGVPMMQPGDRDLSRICNGPTLDAVVLEFNFKTSYDSISFSYFFGSEEYPEYVNQGVNDVFAFFISEMGSRERYNLARLPNNKGPITVDNVNESRNQEFYIPNEPFLPNDIMQYKGKEEEGELSLTYQFDGFTTVLDASTRVKPDTWYHLKIAIADVGDELYDSGVFLKANSFRPYESAERIKQKKLERELFANFTNAELKETNDGNLLLITHIPFDFDKSDIKTESEETLNRVFGILKKKPDWTLKVMGHTDDQGETEYNQSLSEERSAAVTAYLIQKGIDPARIEHFGYGETQPLEEATTESARAINRRVEFEFVR